MSAGGVSLAPGQQPGVTLHYRLDGPVGAPVVTLLHSLATHGGLWDAQAELLSMDHRVLRVDLRGHGQSTGGGDAFDIALLASDVIAIWDALGFARSAIVGLSLGGMIALHLGLHHPDRVACVIAADCRSDAPPAFVDLWHARRHMLTHVGMSAVVDATMPTWFTPETIAGDRAMIGRVAAMIRATSVDGYMGATFALQHLALRPALSGITVPVRYVVGARDGVHPEAMRDMAAATPGADLIEIADASHLANLEQPAAFADAMLPFLAAHLRQEVAV